MKEREWRKRRRDGRIYERERIERENRGREGETEEYI